MEDMNQQYEPVEEVGDGAAAGCGGGDVVLLKKGPWTAGEDAILVEYVEKHGEGNWNNLQKLSGLLRCGKSCRLRWANHLRPNLKKGAFTREEERLIIELHAKIGNKWARMAAQLPGRTDNEIKNYWNTRVKRRQRAGLPVYPLDLQILPPLHSSCLPPQSDTTSLGSSADSHPHLHHLPSPKKDSLRFNLTNLHKETQTVLLLQNAVCDLNVPTASAGNHNVQSLKRPAAQTSDANATAKRICVISSLSQGFPMEPDPGINSSLYPNVSGKQAAMSGFYTSFGLHSSPKLELPSGQCVEAAESAGICTPPALSTPFTSFFLSKSATSDPSASNNGLLESLLQESEAKGRNSKQFLQTRDQTIFQMSDKFCVGGESKSAISSYNASTALLGGSAEMEQLLISANLSYRWKHESTTHSSPPLRPLIKLEESSGALACTYPTLELSPNSNLSRPDHILVSEWNNMQFDTAHAISWHKETQTESDFLHVVKEVDSGHLGHTTTAADLFWELESCQWNNMPGACQIGDFASDLRRFNSMAEQSGGPRAIF